MATRFAGVGLVLPSLIVFLRSKKISLMGVSPGFAGGEKTGANAQRLI